MSLESFLEQLRNKPEHIRRHYAFWSSLGVTAVIFLFWLAAHTSVGDTAKGTVTQAVNRAGTPIQSLVAGVGTFFVDIKDMVFGPKKIEYSEKDSLIISPGNR